MTREETRAWIQSLKSGDKVIALRTMIDGDADVIAVEKVTPSGIVKTKSGNFSQTKYNDHASQLGDKKYIRIVPYSEEMEQKIEARREELIEKDILNFRFRVARRIARLISIDYNMEEAFMEKFLEFIKDNGGKYAQN